MQQSLVGPLELPNPMEEALRHVGARLAAAWRQGARGCTTQTGPGTLSEHNIRRAGFHLAYQHVDFIGQSSGGDRG